MAVFLKDGRILIVTSNPFRLKPPPPVLKNILFRVALQIKSLATNLYIIIFTSRYPVGISTEFCFRWQKKSSRWEGEGDKGGKEEEKNKQKTGEKTEGEKRKKWKEPWRAGELNCCRASISLKSPMPYTYCDSQASL